MKSIKLGHALSFYMHRKVFSPKKIRGILGISKDIGFLSPPYYVFDNLSGLSIYVEVLALAQISKNG